jgi:uncharacterized membrane protein
VIYDADAMQDLTLSPERARFNRVIVGALDWLQVRATRHWLAVLNGALALALGLAILAPLLMAAGQPDLARPIYWIYQAVCHQWPFRTFFLFGADSTYSAEQIAAMVGADHIWNYVGGTGLGYKMAFCERDFAIVAAGLLMGLLYTRLRRRLAPPHLALFFGLLLPIAFDGVTQLVGLRESTWEFRVATGALAGAAAVWLTYPYLELVAERWLAAANWAHAAARSPGSAGPATER